MDDKVFEILIALYFVFALIGSYLKKKKKEEQKRKNLQAVPVEASDEIVEVESREDIRARRDRETREMLNKILGVQIPQQDNEDLAETVKDEYIPDEQQEELPTWHPEEEFEEVEEDVSTKHDNSLDDMLARQYELPQAESEFQAPSMLNENDFVDKTIKANDEANPLNKKLLKMLRNPETLKEAILLTEIINKPKALRRYG